MSITALGSDDLERMGATNLLDFAVRVPNLAMAYEADGRFDSSSPSMRGVFGKDTTGFYIDDITIEGAYTGNTGTSGGSPEVVVPMGAPFPNPSHETVSVHLFSEIQRDWTLGMYDICGRIVSEIIGASPVNSTVNLNISDLAPGVYFLRFSAETETSRKLVILR